jgi:hypothetical protein
MTLAMSGAKPEDAGLASGLVNTSAQVGGAVGLAILATLATQRTDDLTAAGATATNAALNSGYHLAYLVGAGLVGIGMLLAIFVLRSPQMPPEQEQEEVEAASEAATREPVFSEML